MASKYVLINKLPMGIPGDVTRRADAIISNRVNGGTATINFGDLVSINADGSVGLFDGTGIFKGIAVTNIKANLAVTQMEGEFREGDFTDVLERGSVLVKFDGNGTVAAGAPVYYVMVGGKAVATADPAGGNEIPNAVFTTGYDDDEDVIEITINTRN